MQGRKLQIPAFRDESVAVDGTAVPASTTDGMFNTVVVVRWGRVAGFTFRAGDRLILKHGSDHSGLLLLRPRGYGWPMLGSRRDGVLYAEPGGVRAAPQRWQISAGVVGVERALGRAVTDPGRWQVEVVARGGVTEAQLRAAGLVGGALDHLAVDALCHRAARWMDAGHGAVAVGIASTGQEAAQLAASCAAGRLRISTVVKAPKEMGTPVGASVVVGPWSPLPGRDSVPGGITDRSGVRYEVPAMAPPDPERAAQVPLFRRLRSNRAC